MITHGLYTILENVDDLKLHDPELIKRYENISDINELRNELYKELVDSMNMETRVQYFMIECTNNFSKTNYSIDSLELLVNDKKNSDIKEAIKDEVEEIVYLLEDIKESILNNENLKDKLNTIDHLINKYKEDE